MKFLQRRGYRRKTDIFQKQTKRSLHFPNKRSLEQWRATKRKLLRVAFEIL